MSVHSGIKFFHVGHNKEFLGRPLKFQSFNRPIKSHEVTFTR